MKKIYTLLFFFNWLVTASGQAGTLNPSFGTGGYTTTTFADESDAEFRAIAIQADGKIVAAGNTGIGNLQDVAIARYNTDGTLDNTFSGDGKLTTDFGGSDQASAVAIQADGKIVVAGFRQRQNLSSEFAVARYNTDGSPDKTFSGDGMLTANFGGDDYATAVVIQTDQKIVVVGRINVTFGLVRYNADGMPDNTFSGDGLQTTDFGGIASATSVVIQQNNKIVVAGTVYFKIGGNVYNPDFAVARYNADGSLNNSLSGGGKQTTGFDNNG